MLRQSRKKLPGLVRHLVSSASKQGKQASSFGQSARSRFVNHSSRFNSSRRFLSKNSFNSPFNQSLSSHFRLKAFHAMGLMGGTAAAYMIYQDQVSIKAQLSAIKDALLLPPEKAKVPENYQFNCKERARLNESLKDVDYDASLLGNVEYVNYLLDKAEIDLPSKAADRFIEHAKKNAADRANGLDSFTQRLLNGPDELLTSATLFKEGVYLGSALHFMKGMVETVDESQDAYIEHRILGK